MAAHPINRPFLVQREHPHAGLHLVPMPATRVEPAQVSALYRITAVGAALFLLFTVC